MKLGWWTVAIATLLGGCAPSDGDAGGLDVKEIGSFHVGGRHVQLSGLPASVDVLGSTTCPDG